MAFERNNGNAPATNAPRNNQRFDPAAGFLNVSVQNEDGTFSNIGGVPLRLQSALHEALMELDQEQLDALILKVEIRRIDDTPKSFAFAKRS